MSFLYLNGSILPEAEAHISPFDRGLLFGDGLFETLRVYGGRPHLLREHLERLRDGAEALAIALPPAAELAAAVAATIAANTMPGVTAQDGTAPDASASDGAAIDGTAVDGTAIDGALRLTVTRGVGESLLEPGSGPPTILISIRPLLHSAELSVAERIIALPVLHGPPAIGRRVKALNYLPAVVASQFLARAGVREGVLRTAEGWVAEGTVSNLFLVRGKELVTPPLALGILAGVTRARILAMAPAAGLRAREEMFTLVDMAAADECFYTNSLREVVPVAALDGVPIGAGAAGPRTRALQALYREDVRRGGE